MDKKYSVDDILSEVRRKKEQNKPAGNTPYVGQEQSAYRAPRPSIEQPQAPRRTHLEHTPPRQEPDPIEVSDEPMLIGQERASDIASFFSQRDEEQLEGAKVRLSRKEKQQQERDNKRRALNEEIHKARQEPPVRAKAPKEAPAPEEGGLFARMGQYDPQNPDKISLFSKLSAPGEDEREEEFAAQQPVYTQPLPTQPSPLQGLEFGDDEEPQEVLDTPSAPEQPQPDAEETPKESPGFFADSSGFTLEQPRFDISTPASSAHEPKEGFQVDTDLAPGDATRLNMAFAQRQRQARMQEEENEPSRMEKVKKSALFSNEEAGDEEPQRPQSDSIDEYSSPQDAKSILVDLNSLRSSIVLRLILSLVGFGFLAYISLAGALQLPVLSMLERATEPVIFMVANIIVLFVMMVVNMQAIFGGIASLFKLKANADSFTALTTLAVFIQLLVMLFSPDRVAKNQLEVFPAIAAGAMLLNACGKLLMVNRMLRNFKFVSSDKTKYSAQKIEDEAFAWELCRGLNIDDAQVLVSRPAKFLTNFLEYSYSEDPVDAIARLLAPIGVCGALLVAVFSYFIYGNAFASVTAFATVICAFCPLASVIAGNLPLSKVSKTLRRYGAVLPGAKSLEDHAGTNAVVVSAQDLFPEGTLVLHGIKTFGSSRIDEAILDAASVILNTGGTLADIFNQVIVGKQDMLRPVDTLVYEDMMGVSAWVDQKRVLIGNRDLMRHHGIDAPTKDYEARYRKDGRDLIYLTNSGEIAAMFVVSYTAREDIGDALYYLQREGVSLIVNTTDCNVTAEKIAQVFDVDPQMIQIMPGKLHSEYAPLITPKARASSSLCHLGSFTAFARGVILAIRARKVYTLTSVLVIAAAAIGYAGCAFFTFISGLSHLNLAVLLLYQVIWSLILVIAPNIKRL